MTWHPHAQRYAAGGLNTLGLTALASSLGLIEAIGIETIAVGSISEADHVNSILAAGRADLCALARPHLADPAWTLHEAARIGITSLSWPKQYQTAKGQYEANLARAAAAASEGGH